MVTASDRKFTAGDWTYEPQQTKHHAFGANAVALISGTASAHAVMCNVVDQWLASTPTQDVGQIANWYALAFADYRRQEAERSLLAPLNLSPQRLLTDPQLPDALVARLINELRRWKLEDAAIITGIDGVGNARIYAVQDPGWATCEDATGFTAVGSGAGHAMAQFMLNNYDRGWPAARAILLTYSAKKRAEVDPFVGTTTDMLVIGPGVAPGAPLHEALFQAVEKIYADTQSLDRALTQLAYKKFEEHVEEFLQNQQKATAKQSGEVQTEPNETPNRASLKEGESQD